MSGHNCTCVSALYVCIGLKEEVLTWMVNGANLGYLGSFSKEKMHCSEENLEVFGLPALNI